MAFPGLFTNHDSSLGLICSKTGYEYIRIKVVFKAVSTKNKDITKGAGQRGYLMSMMIYRERHGFNMSEIQGKMPGKPPPPPHHHPPHPPPSPPPPPPKKKKNPIRCLADYLVNHSPSVHGSYPSDKHP